MTTRIAVTAHAPLIAIFKELAGRGKYEFLTPYQQFEQQLVNLELPVVEFRDFVSRRQAVAHADAAIALSKSLAYPVGDHLASAVNDWWQHDVGGYLYPRMGELALVAHALSEADPDMVIVHNDVEMTPRIMALWGRAHGKPVLHIPHAVYLPHADRGPAGEDIHDWLVADHVAVAGPAQGRWFSERGVRHIHRTGLPQNDKWAAPSRLTPVHARKLLELDPGRPVVAYGSSWRQDTNLLGGHDGVGEAYEAFLAAMQQPGMDKAQYVIKTHPHGRNLDVHLALARQAGVSCVVTDQHLGMVLQASDLLISYGPSNLLLKATFFPHLRTAMLVETAYQGATDRRVPCINPTGEEIAIAIRRMLARQAQHDPSFRNDYLGYNEDGKAYKRIAGLIRKLVDNA